MSGDIKVPTNVTLNKFLNKLEYLKTVGYNQDVIKSFKQYCLTEVFDEDSIIDDLDDIQDSSIIEHLVELYDWDDKTQNDFFLKIRQALDIDDKPEPKPKPKQESKPPHPLQPQQKPPSKLYVSAQHIDYNLTQDEFNIHKEIYFKQCSRLLPLDQRTGDEALLRVLAIGRKNNTPLLQNIADTYSRIRINQFVSDKKSDLKESEFALGYDYFRSLKRRNEKRNAEYLKSALQSFHKRICPKIQFQSLLKINDSISDYFEYVSATIKFVHNVIDQGDALPPFQIDFWIIPKNVKSGMKEVGTKLLDDISVDEEEDEDESEEDSTSQDDEDGCHYADFPNTKQAERAIGDIEARLQHEKLIHDNYTVKFNSPLENGGTRRFLRELDKKCKDFWKKRQNKMKQEFNIRYSDKYVEPDRTGAHKTRICIVIDRRKPQDPNKKRQSQDIPSWDSHSSNQAIHSKRPSSSQYDNNNNNNKNNKKTWEDRMYIYAPPKNCSIISDTHVPESYFNSSKECILPGKGYNNGKRDEFELKNNGFIDDNNTADIEVGSSIGGYQFTLSFHVESIDNIKAYIFYQGWIARFFPQDMIDIWPLWFSDSKENKDFINNPKKWKSRVNDLQRLLSDDQFHQWYKDSTKRDDLLKKY